MSSTSNSPSPSPGPENKKRKRSSVPADELEIDVNLPEPPSKKAARRLKKGKSITKTEASAEDGDGSKDSSKPSDASDPTKRSEYGIWIGNLPFTADRSTLRTFLSTHANIEEADITRLHMPSPATSRQEHDARPKINKPQNKGFAYVDFASADVLAKALELSETLMTGRKVLIKDAKSFVGRPEKKADDGTGAGGAAAKGVPGSKPPSKRVFVGNLGFDVAKDDLETHFAQAGEIEDVHMATFEDSGKCKGFAWVRFVELESAENAVRGFVFKEEGGDDDEDEDVEEEVKDDASEGSGDEDAKPKKAKKAKKNKKRKWFINRLMGRPLRCEFAEDAQVRYKKRFGKNPPTGEGRPAQNGETAADGDDAGAGDAAPARRPRMKGDKDQRQEQRRLKHVDARTIRPGAALANAPRASGAIVQATGKKTTFDE